MPASEFAKALDEIQRYHAVFIEGDGFKVRGRSFNRVTEDGLTQVVYLQMGAS